MHTRRTFLRSTALAAASALAAPHLLRAQAQPPSPYRKLVTGRPIRVAAVGIGGKGMSDLFALASEEIVALCDVDFQQGAHSFRAFPTAARYRDFRRMFHELGDRIDAVTIATPDHMHFPIALMAIEHGLHVYLQKPLTQTIGEARILKAAAAKAGVVTQMGNQGHANEGTRLTREWVEADAIGPVREATIWTNRPVWPQGVVWPASHGLTPPSTLDWNLWLGVAPERPYRPDIAPFNWRGFWDYGTGAMGDMGCHMLDAPFWALNLRGPVRVTATSTANTLVSGPTAAIIRYEFPARGSLPPLKLTWMEGTHRPDRPPELPQGEELAHGGYLLRGDSGVIYSPGDYSESPRLLPDSLMASTRRPPRLFPRVPKANPHLEWLQAIRGGPVPGSNWVDHAADLTEFTLLGNLAIRLGKPIDWDPIAGRCIGLPEADALIHKNYRVF